VLNTAKIEPGSTVAVFGAGGVGLAAIQGARIAGARKIIAVDMFEGKLAMAKRMGATDTVDASNSDPVDEIRQDDRRRRRTTRSKRSVSKKPPSRHSIRSRPAAPRL